MLLIWNTTNGWMNSWLFFTHTTSEKSAKLFSKKLSHAIRLRNLTQSCLHSIRLLCCARFIQHKLVINAHLLDIVFFQTALLIFFIVRVKRIKISSSRWWRFELATSAITLRPFYKPLHGLYSKEQLNANVTNKFRCSPFSLYLPHTCKSWRLTLEKMLYISDSNNFKWQICDSFDIPHRECLMLKALL